MTAVLYCVGTWLSGNKEEAVTVRPNACSLEQAFRTAIGSEDQEATTKELHKGASTNLTLLRKPLVTLACPTLSVCAKQLAVSQVGSIAVYACNVRLQPDQ